MKFVVFLPLMANWQIGKISPEKIFTILFESVQNVHTGILCHLVERGDGYALSVAFQAVGKLFVAFFVVVVGILPAEVVENLSALLSDAVGEGEAQSQPVVVALCDVYMA